LKRSITVALGSGLALALLAACAKNSNAEQSAGTTASGPPGAGAALADVSRGQTIFAQNCASCHGAHAEGGIGPSLEGEKSRKDDKAAIAWIKNPQPPMPKLYPAPLGEQDVEDVAAYVESL